MKAIAKTGLFLAAVALWAAQPHAVLALSPQEKCNAQKGDYQWDGTGLRYCCYKTLRVGTHFARKSAAWCIKS